MLFSIHKWNEDSPLAHSVLPPQDLLDISASSAEKSLLCCPPTPALYAYLVKNEAGVVLVCSLAAGAPSVC